MWNLMMMGHEPFKLDDSGNLVLELAPILPAEFFDDEHKVSFTFLGQATVTYVNPTGLDTWESGATVSHASITGTGTTDALDKAETIVVEGSSIPSKYAQAARDGGVESITVYFGN